MNKFSVLALVALSAMAGIASSQNPALNTCVALAGGMGSTKSTITGTSATVCYYSDAACATSADTLCGQMRTMAGEGASACKDGCLSASAVTNTNTNTNTETKTETPALNTCVAIAGMGSTKSTTTGTSATVCYYSDAACATSADTFCGQMRTMAEEEAKAAGQSVSRSACKDGCFSASAGTNTNTNTNTETKTETKTETNSGGTNSGGTSQSGASDGSTEGTGSNQPPAGAEGGSTQGTASNHDDASHDGHAGHDDGADVTNSPVATVDVQAAGHSEKEGGGDIFASLSAAEQKELGLGNKGDKCKGFKIFFASQALEKKCQAEDTETACVAEGCEYECMYKVNSVCKQSNCRPSAASQSKLMGVDSKKMEAEMLAKLKGAKTLEDRMKIQKDMVKKYAKSMVPVMNDLNTTMVEIAKFIKRCGGGKTKAACAADKVCELQLAFNASTDNFTQQCNVNKAKAVEETGCSGVAKAVADLDALERKAVAAGAKKALAGKQEKQKAAKKAVTDYKEANPTATADTDNALKALETKAASADAEVIAASATVTTADAEATAAKQKADATPEDSSTLRALPSIMAVVAATVAAAFA